MKTTIAAACLALTLAGCASSSKVMLGSARPPVDPAVVQVYSTTPPGAVEIAQVEATSAVGFGTQGQTDAALLRLKEEAAKLGANGIVLVGVGANGRSPASVSVGAGSWGSSVGGGVGIGIPTQQKSAAGVAIYVPPGTPTQPVPMQNPPPGE